jgi:hypothetical protein
VNRHNAAGLRHDDDQTNFLSVVGWKDDLVERYEIALVLSELQLILEFTSDVAQPDNLARSVPHADDEDTAAGVG